MLSALHAITRRPSVCLSVRHTGGSYKSGWRQDREIFGIR